MKFSDKEFFVGGILLIIVLALLVNLFLANPSNLKYCGDGKCTENEMGSCELDCNWCGDKYCQDNESCSSCEADCGSCNAEAYCGDGICNAGECDIGCTKDCPISQCQNGKCEPEAGENCVTSPVDCKCSDNEKCDNSKCVQLTCGNGVCDSSESFVSCPNDCKQGSFVGEEVNPDTNYPIIFVHGHSVETQEVSTFSINAFTEFQNKLVSDNLYLDKGIILPNSELTAFNEGEWGRLDKPISVRTTYYTGTLDPSSGVFIQSSETTRSINEYGGRLGKVVDIVLHHTGKSKVIIISHSMGGLVSRAYIKNYGGANKVDKLIEIGSPNHGVYGWVIGGLCGTTHSGQECEDMQHDSSFIANLNSGDESYGSVKYFTIAGSCDNNGEDYHDEVVRVGSVKLEGATNNVVSGKCVGTTSSPLDGAFHSDLISPSKVPEVYNLVKEFLKA